MGRSRLPASERKELFTVRLKRKYIDEIKEIPQYNKVIEDIIVKFLKNRQK